MHGTVAPIVASCAHTIVGKIVGELHALYEEIEEKQKKWLVAAPRFSCPSGCGKCCNGFEPDVLECEALYLASWMLLHQRERAIEFSGLDSLSRHNLHPDGCPLQAGETGYGSCGVYGGRALVCRLFGYCGDTGRDGKVRFKICRYHPLSVLPPAGSPVAVREFSQETLERDFGALPPPMADFGSRAVQLMNESGSNTELLGTALPRALRKILMLENLNRSSLLAAAIETGLESSDGGDNDTPNPTPLLPKAG